MNSRDRKRLEEIAVRRKRSTPGEWHWEYTYGLKDGSHWCLVSTVSPAGQCIDGQLVTHTNQCFEVGDGALVWDSARLCERPNWQLLAHAPGDLDFLLKLVADLQAVVKDMQEESSAYQCGVKDATPPQMRLCPFCNGYRKLNVYGDGGKGAVVGDKLCPVCNGLGTVLDEG